MPTEHILHHHWCNSGITGGNEMNPSVKPIFLIIKKIVSSLLIISLPSVMANGWVLSFTEHHQTAFRDLWRCRRKCPQKEQAILRPSSMRPIYNFSRFCFPIAGSSSFIHYLIRKRNNIILDRKQLHLWRICTSKFCPLTYFSPLPFALPTIHVILSTRIKLSIVHQ